MLLNRIKTLLQINDNDELIYEIAEITKEKILNYINQEELPKELEFILVEMAVSRFNKKGVELEADRQKEKRINTEITRKVCLVALTDATKAVKITIS